MNFRAIHKMAGSLILTACGLGAVSANAALITASGPGANLVDQQTPGTSHTLNVAQSGSILDLNVSVTLVDSGGGGSQWGDLDMFLTHGTTTVQLLDWDNPDDCCSGSDGTFDVTFDDAASSVLGSVSGSPAVSGTYKPENGLLSDFNGLDVMGDWTLTIIELEGFFNETDLEAWSITARVPGSGNAPEPTSVALFGLGLAGLFGASRRRKLRT